ncbi:MAG: aldehyde dehydrogenase family protein [Pseudomonadales bacterium]|nr:aldehyde dehydrogenase family protein [Pseudomonadales bacterium]
MYDYRQFYINGKWTDPVEPNDFEVTNPATEKSIGTISLGSSADVDKAVAAAKAAFESYSQTSVEERVKLLQKVLAGYQQRLGDIGKAISAEMGAPKGLANAAQAPAGMAHLMSAIEILKNYPFEERRGGTNLVKEPIGVCALITPWNWPINQIAAKVAPALAAGCTVVLKPSEIAPIDAAILAEIIDEAGFPPGVFNLVNGDGPGVGVALTSHPDVDMVSFTGSTRAGVAIAKNAADTIKRVAQELGGKSANIILPSADLESAVAGGVTSVFTNTGQSCNAPTRMLVHEDQLAVAAQIAKAAAEKTVVGEPTEKGVTMGPVVSETQWDKIQVLIQKGIDEGADLVTGGTGKPEGLETGYFVKPTIFSNVTNDMSIAQQEVFGPVLSILPYKDEEDAIRIANDTVYGLSGYVSGDIEEARKVAKRLRTGNVHLNGAPPDFGGPFGGYKQSGNGREWGVLGFEEYLEIKAIMGYS